MLRASPLSRWRGRLDVEQKVLLCLSVVAFLVVVVAHPGEVFVDTKFDLYLAPLRMLQDTLSTWVSGSGLGTPNYNTGFLPVTTVMAALHVVGVPTWLLFRLWRFALLLVAAAGARAFLRDLTASDGGLGAPGRIAAAVLYVVNPYVVVGAATTPIMVPYAFFPWLMLMLRLGFRGSRLAWGAAFALTMFFVGGINAGVVPAFLMVAVVPIAIDAWRRERVPVRDILLGLVVAGTATLLVSAYWLVGTASAFGTASAVADATEDPRTVASVSSFAEVMRGLGSWLVYGGDTLGPYRPGFVSFLTSPLVVAATFVLPLLAVAGAMLATQRVRRLLVALALLGLTLMVGGYPPDDPSPFGRALLWTFDHVPGAVAFRTTSKAGAIAMLAMAGLGALGVDAAGRRWRGAHVRQAIVGAVAVVLVISVAPVWVGKLLPGGVPIPSYWDTAAHDLDTRGDDGRVWALPGETNAFYRWRPFSVDDVANSLLSRPVVYAHSYPDGPTTAWNAMAGVSEGLDGEGSTGSLVSTYAQYLGASDVLLRNDMVWEVMGVPRPLALVATLDHDPGLEPSALYGRPGTNLEPTSAGDASLDEARLTPLVRYHVTAPTSQVRLYPTTGQLLVAGDNAAVPSAVWAGLLDGDRPFRMLADTPSSAVASALEDGGRLLLTDSNRRRSSNTHELDLSGPLLSAEADPDSPRTLGKPDDQTVASYTGIRDVQATASGSIFGPTPGGRPFLALDGDDATAWQFGNFNTARGARLTVTFDEPTRISTLGVRRQGGSPVKISTFRVTAGGATAVGGFANTDATQVSLPHPVLARKLTLTITGVAGSGFYGVGISTLSIPGVTATESARMPRTIQRLATQPDTGRLVADAPVDLLLTRAAPEDEGQLVRDFSLPSEQSYDLRAEVTGNRDAWEACRPVLNIGAQVVRARAARPQGRHHPGVVELTGCRPTLVTAGSHRLTTVPGVQRVFLGSRQGSPTEAVGRGTAAEEPFWQGDRASYDVQVPDSQQSRFLVLAQGYDARWHAVVGGKDLGKPTELNGFALGWELPAGTHGDVHLFFGPQGGYRIVLLFSLAWVLVLCGVLVVSRRRMRRTA